MYKIIGGDQREYGPVSAELVRDWLSQGRLSRETPVLVEGASHWSTLGQCPEFSDAFATHPPALSSPTSSGDPAFSGFANRAASLDIGSCLSRSWTLLLQHFWLLVGASGIVFVVTLAFYFVPVIGTVAHAVLGLALWGGLDWLFLKLVRGQPADIGDIFAGFQIEFLQLALAGVVTSVLIFVGLLLCVLPGIYLMLAWLGFSPLLIIDKRLEFWPAMELSRRVVTKALLTMCAFFLVSLVLLIGGVLALGVGFFVALPLATGAVVYAYEDIFGAISPGWSS